MRAPAQDRPGFSGLNGQPELTAHFRTTDSAGASDDPDDGEGVTGTRAFFANFGDGVNQALMRQSPSERPHTAALILFRPMPAGRYCRIVQEEA
jgi:hypothetical protein